MGDEADIERMVADAEKYKAEDEAVKARLDARNGLESFAYNLKNTAEESLKNQLEEADRDVLLAKVNETIAWLDANQQADKDEYEDKRKELQVLSDPIIKKAYANQGV